MKYVVPGLIGLIVLVACANRPTSLTPESAIAPACPETACPERVCAACPACPTCPGCLACPKPEEVIASDWHCLNLYRPGGDVSGYCFTLPEICERKRGFARKNEFGEPGSCVTQHTAFCVRVSDPNSMSRQVLCARTHEGCEVRRAYLRDHPERETDEVGVCRELLNTDPFTERDSASDIDGVP